MWPLLLFAHVVGLVGYNLALRRSMLAKADPWTTAALLSTGISVPLLPFLFFGHIDTSVYTAEIVWRMVAAVTLEVLIQITVVQALRYLEVGVFSILFNLRVVFTTILGILFLGEAVVPFQILGGVLILAGIVIVGHKGRKKFGIVGLLWGVAAAISISLISLVHKGLINDIGYFNDVLLVLPIATVAMWTIVVSQRKKVTLALFRRSDTIRLMVFRALSGHAVILALATGAVISVANYISSLSVIVIVALGALFMNERDHIKEKIIATGLAAFGLTCILIANL